MAVSRCYCGATNHHAGEGLRVDCHACPRAYVPREVHEEVRES